MSTAKTLSLVDVPVGANDPNIQTDKELVVHGGAHGSELSGLLSADGHG